MAGRELRDQIFRLTNADAGAAIQFRRSHLIIMEYRFQRVFPLPSLAARRPRLRPNCRTTSTRHQQLDENGQGKPYAVYGSARTMAEIEVDTELGTVRV